MITLVPYNDSFKDILARFVVSFWKAHHSEVNMEQAKQTLNEWTENDHRLFVIMLDDCSVGFLRVHNSSPTVCWIDDIYVDEPYRRRGIASAVIRQIEMKLRSEGSASFCMEVVPDNAAAMRLYHGLGYDRLSMVVMRKDSDEFETERVETIAGLPMRVRKFF